jgi:hypothetical protein
MITTNQTTNKYYVVVLFVEASEAIAGSKISLQRTPLVSLVVTCDISADLVVTLVLGVIGYIWTIRAIRMIREIGALGAGLTY